MLHTSYHTLSHTHSILWLMSNSFLFLISMGTTTELYYFQPALYELVDMVLFPF